MFTYGFHKVQNLRITRVFLQETGTYNKQFVRPYNTMLDQFTLKALVDKSVSSNGGRLDANTFSGMAGQFIMPQATPEAEIALVGGWNERRIRFMMEVTCDFSTGGTSNIYVQGYTDFQGITNNQHIAPDMVFYINSLITTRKTAIPGPFGIQEVETIIDNSHLLCNNGWNSILTPGQQSLLRPQDIFHRMETSSIPGVADGSTLIADARVTVRNEATKSYRSNGLPAAYTAKVIDGYIGGQHGYSYAQNQEDIFSSARGKVSEEPVVMDPFLAAISQIKGNNIINNRFTYRDLQALAPYVDSVTKYFVMGHAERAKLHQANTGTAEWHSSDRTTVVASILSQSVPAIMMDLMLSNLVFKSTNHDFTGQMNTIVIYSMSFSSMKLERFVEMFKRRLEDEVIKDITFGNQVSYLIEMRVDLLGETWISIALEGRPAIEYVVPSFCDNLFVPVVSSNMDTVRIVTSDFETLINHVTEATSQQTNIFSKV